MEKKYKSNHLNESQLTLFYQSWNYLQKVKVDVFVERHLKNTKKTFLFVQKEIWRNYLKTSTLFISPLNLVSTDPIKGYKETSSKVVKL